MVFLLLAILIYFSFQKVFSCPECYLYQDTGDGLKNYFTLAYYVENDSNWHFTGMNYPYGEQVFYTDNQPILALVLQFIDKYITDLNGNVVGTLNMLLILSIYLAILLTYVLQRRWQVGRVWALLTSTCIILLSPQLHRLTGHYGLAYVCFFPATFLLLDLTVSVSKRKWLWILLLCLTTIIFSLIHLYFLLITTAVVFLWMGWFIWHERTDRQKLKSRVFQSIVMVFAPAACLIAIKVLTDQVADRPIFPWGIDQFFISFETSFYSFIPPFNKATESLMPKGFTYGTEQTAYVGLMGLLMLPAMFYYLFKKFDPEQGENVRVKVALLTAACCWLIGAGILYLYGLKFIWDIIPFLKQFRSLGRFGIPFAFLYGIVMSYILWKVYEKLVFKDLRTPAVYLLSAVVLVWSAEAWWNFKAARDPMFKPNEYMNVKPRMYVPILESAGFKPEDFQAILQLPIVAIGNETFGEARGFWTMNESIHCSMETRLPQMTFALSRTSISQGLDLVELIAPPYFEKTRLKECNDKPLLLLCNENHTSENERYWISKAKPIGSVKEYTLYALDIAVMREIQIPSDPVNNVCNGWMDGFENTACDTSFTGKGAFVVNEAPSLIWTTIDTAQTERTYIFSFWAYIDNKHASLPVPRIKETTPEGEVTYNTGWHREGLVWDNAYRNWIEVKFPFVLKGHNRRYELFIDNAGPVIDQLLIRPEIDTCVQLTDEFRLYQNTPTPGRQ